MTSTISDLILPGEVPAIAPGQYVKVPLVPMVAPAAPNPVVMVPLRFLVLSGCHYIVSDDDWEDDEYCEPVGWECVQGCFGSLSEALNFAQSFTGEAVWWQVVDLPTLSVIEHSDTLLKDLIQLH